MQSSLKNHMKQFGQDGHFTFHAGLSIEQAEEIGAERVKRSMLHDFKAGNEVVIRGCDVVCRIKKVLGIDVVLEWPTMDWRSFDAVQAINKGRWNLGDVSILKAHIELVEWVA